MSVSPLGGVQRSLWRTTSGRRRPGCRDPFDGLWADRDWPGSRCAGCLPEGALDFRAGASRSPGTRAPGPRRMGSHFSLKAGGEEYGRRVRRGRVLSDLTRQATHGLQNGLQANGLQNGEKSSPSQLIAAMGFKKRRARDSNPQPVARHLISSQAANRSRTLRPLLINIMAQPDSGKLACARPWEFQGYIEQVVSSEEADRRNRLLASFPPGSAAFSA
jgi:hypothetical protein